MKPLTLLLVANLLLAIGTASHAGQYRVIKSFAGNGSEGAVPEYYGAFVGNSYIGAASTGGLYGYGVLYRIDLDGTDFQVLRSFNESDGKPESPWHGATSALLYHDGKVHGVLQRAQGGNSQVTASIFSVNPDGSSFTVTKEIVDGQFIDLGGSAYTYRNEGGQVSLHFVKEGYLYGLAQNGAAPESPDWQQGYGGIFRVRPDGTDYSVIHRFGDLLSGRRPGCLVDGGDYLYGVAWDGGIVNRGVVFRIRPDGTDFSKIKDLLIEEVGNESMGGPYMLRFHGGQLFFMSETGGKNGQGVAFAIDPSTGIMTKLHEFGKSPSFYYPADFVVNDGDLFGVVLGSSTASRGGIFRMRKDGTGFRELHGFQENSSWPEPRSLAWRDGRLFGLLKSGGSSGAGALFSYEPSAVSGPTTPVVSILPTGAALSGLPTANQPALPRYNHSVLWTGNRFIVWGGAVNETASSTGGVYDPVGDFWTPTALSNAPKARLGHTAVWTGNRMIIWGGRNSQGNALADGVSFDPAVNSWTPITGIGAPSARSGHTAVWTGQEMIVWGGDNGEVSGGAYNPSSGTWRPLSTLGAPESRYGHDAIMAGSRMVVWGGNVDDGEQPDGTGAFYNPASDTWEEIPSAGAPTGGFGDWGDDSEARAVQLLWTGSKLVAFPLNSSTGAFWLEAGIYDPATKSWQLIRTTGAPDVRPYMAAWLGSTLYVAGSSGINFRGSVYDFNTNRWRVLTTGTTGSFQGREGVWAPQRGELLTFGGRWVDGVGEFSGGSAGRKGFRIKFQGLVSPIDWSWAAGTADRNLAIGESATFGVESQTPGVTYQWYRNGRKIAGATGASFTVANASPDDAGSYRVDIISVASGKRVVRTPSLRLVVDDPGILVYTYRGNERFTDRDGSQSAVASGYFLVDRENRQAAEIVADHGKKRFRVNSTGHDIKIFSTGPLPTGTRTAACFLESAPGSFAVAWYEGADKRVGLAPGFSVIAPPAMRAWAGAAFDEEETGTTMTSWGLTLTLEKVQTLRARSFGYETLSESTERLRQELLGRGFTEE